MVCYNGNNTLVLGGFNFSKMHNRKKGILVTSVDHKDTTKSVVVVVSSKEGSELNEDVRSRILRRNNNHQEDKETELEANALLFCRLVNKLLQNQNSSCFVGCEVIYEMVSSGLAKNRAEALAFGKALSKKIRIFYRVEFKRNTFSDDGKLYKCRPEVLLSVIMKSPMSIQKLTPSDTERVESKPTSTIDFSYGPMKFRKFAPKIDVPELKQEEIQVSRNRITGKPKKKGRRPKGKESVNVDDQMHMITQKQSPLSEEDWRKPNNYGHRGTMESIRERGESSEDGDHSIYTEVTVSDHNNALSFPSVHTEAQHEEDEASYMEFTVSTRDTHSYFDEYTLDDEDEEDSLSVPTTPVVLQKIKVPPKYNAPANDFSSLNDVAGFDNSVAPKSRRSAKANRDSSLSSRIRRGELDIEIPYLNENDEDAFLEEI